MKATKVLNDVFKVDADLNLYVNDKKISRAEMAEISNHYKGANRIYKPFALLFWTDVKNGQLSGWDLIEVN